MGTSLVISHSLHYAMTACANMSPLHHFTCTTTVSVCTSIFKVCVCVCQYVDVCVTLLLAFRHRENV